MRALCMLLAFAVLPACQSMGLTPEQKAGLAALRGMGLQAGIAWKPTLQLSKDPVASKSWDVESGEYGSITIHADGRVETTPRASNHCHLYVSHPRDKAGNRSMKIECIGDCEAPGKSCTLDIDVSRADRTVLSCVCQ